MEFKDKLRNLRTEAGLSQENLADAVHVSRSAIAKYENGGGKPSEETLKLIADYFKVDISYLNDDEEIKKTKKKEENVIKRADQSRRKKEIRGRIAEIKRRARKERQWDI